MRLGHLYFIIALAIAMGPAPAYASELDALAQRLTALRGEVEQLGQGIQDPSRADNRERANRLLIDAKVAFGIADYEDAAVLLYDYVSRYPQSRAFTEALYYLSEALFQKRDYMAAREYFTKLARGSAVAGSYYQQALERLVELSLKLRDDTDVAEWLAALDRIPPGQRRPSVPYVRGKYAYFQNQYTEALRHFAEVPTGTEYHVQARYFIGVCLVARGQLDQAVKVLHQLTRYPIKTAVQEHVIELAHMALARIYYRGNQPEAAVDFYLEVRRRSQLFEEALYEIAWVFVKSRQFDRALQALELLALTNPVSSNLPSVKLLEGNLRIRKAQGAILDAAVISTAEYMQAQAIFENLHSQLRRPHDEIARVIREDIDPRAYMAQITGRLSDVFDASVAAFEIKAPLPEVAAAWVREQPEVKRLIAVENNLAQAEADIIATERMIERLEHALSSPSRVNVFPRLAKKRTRATEVFEELLGLRQQLTALGRGLLSRYENDTEQVRLDALAAERRGLLRELVALPDARISYGERIQRARRRYDELDRRIAEVADAIDTTEAALVALAKYTRDTAEDSAKINEEAHRALRTLRRETDAMRAELDRLRRDLTLARDQTGTGDPATRRAQVLRDQLRRALDREHQTILGIVERMRDVDKTQGTRIAELMRQANEITLDIDGVRANVDRVIDAALTDVRAALVEEKARLVVYRRQFAEYEAESRDLGGDILAAAFAAVRDQLADALLRSEVGIIDVLWSQKEDSDETVQRLTFDKLRELRTLDEAFRQVHSSTPGNPGAAPPVPPAATPDEEQLP